MKKALSNTSLHAEVTNDSSLEEFIQCIIKKQSLQGEDDPFCVVDLGKLLHQLSLWKRELPRVEPFYAVKCNDDPGILSTLAQLGVGFDCASKNEISLVKDLRISSDRIIYANPCKQISHLKYAERCVVSLMTFDNMDELFKIKVHFPAARLLIRILPPDESKSKYKLGNKFGAHPKTVPKLLQTAKTLGLAVVGVSFHVGSDNSDPAAFTAALASARTVFDMGAQTGYQFHLLDIGGGFPGRMEDTPLFEQICRNLRHHLDVYFPESMGVKVKAEPGRFFAASTCTLVVNVIGKELLSPQDQHVCNGKCTARRDVKPRLRYWVNEGARGCFKDCLYEEESFIPQPLNIKECKGRPVFISSLWGPSCEDMDCVRKEVTLPELECGEWLIFKEVGAYTLSLASSYNSMEKLQCHYVMDNRAWAEMMSMKADGEISLSH